MRRVFFAVLISLCLAGMAGAQKKETPAQIKARKEAMWKQHMDKMAKQPKQGGHRLSEAEVRKVALEKFPGKVLSIKLGTERTGKWEYTVVIQQKNHVRDIYVDYVTGVIWGAPARRVAQYKADQKKEKSKKNPWDK